MTMITGEDNLRLFQVMQLRSVLGMEIRSGMKWSHRGSPLSMLQSLGVTSKRTKKGAWLDADSYIVDRGGPSAGRKPF